MHSVMSVLRLFGEAYQKFFMDDAPRLAAALAFYALLSAAPLLIVAVAVAGLVFSQNAIRQDVLLAIGSTVGPQGRDVVQTLFDNAYDAYRPGSGLLASLVGAVLLLIGASGVFAQLNAAVAKIWGTEHRVRGSVRTAVVERVRGIGMVLLVGVLLIAVLAGTTSMADLQRFLLRAMGLTQVGLEIVNFLVTILVVAAFFATVYRALPGTDAAWREVWPGAVAAAPLFAAANLALTYYLGTSAIGSAYGAAGSLVVLLLWTYVASMIFFFGAEVSSVYAARRKARLLSQEDDVDGRRDAERREAERWEEVELEEEARRSRPPRGADGGADDAGDDERDEPTDPPGMDATDDGSHDEPPARTWDAGHRR